ncbi:MAG TPA: ATP-binding protein [Terriglobales bacterium]|nr:ATP-binding protein [Terriglobales bacterium]
MTFRTKLFLIFTLALLVSVGLVAGAVTEVTRRAFNEMNRQHSDALVAQFQREFAQRSEDVVHRVQGIADAEGTVRMAIDLSRPKGDVSVYVNDAAGIAKAHQLNFLDFVSNDGSIISSAEWPARFGYKIDWVLQPEDWAARGSFLMKTDTQEGPALALMSVSRVRVGDKDLYIIGGERLGKEFLASLVLPAGMRALLYLNLDPAFQAANLIDSAGTASQPERFASIIEAERQQPGEQIARINWTADAASAEVFHAMPLLGRQQELLGVLLIGNSQRDVVMLQRQIMLLSIGVVAIGLFLAALLGWWGAARVTRPVRQLAEGAREVAGGNWNARVNVRGTNEIGRLAKAFNQMTEQLVEQRERLLQAERVAAWREVARRLAHELKNPLFPLQTTVENLQRAKQQHSGQFEEVFHESTGILLAEIDNLKNIVGRFSDFAKMPQPETGPVNINDVVRSAVKLFEAQFGAVGRPPITPELHLDEHLPVIQADSALLHRALENLILNAMDAMPSGGVLMLRTSPHQLANGTLNGGSKNAADNGGVHLEISDTGTGLTPEECERLFTPYYTTKLHGTGLGLAIVQSVISDHGGRIWVESETGVGTSFHIELPNHPPRRSVSFPISYEYEKEKEKEPEVEKHKQEA